MSRCWRLLRWGQDAEKLIKASDCSSCHAVDHQVVGPAYSDIAKRYAGQADAADKLAAKIRDGGGGMTPHPDLTDAQRTEIAQVDPVANGVRGQSDGQRRPTPTR